MFFSRFSNTLAYKIRIAYFKAALRQDAAFYDEQKPTEMATKISKEIEAIKAGTGDKIGMTVSAVSTVIFGFGVAFYQGAKLAGILLAFFPLIGCSSVCFMGCIVKGIKDLMQSYTQSAGYAEQALGGIQVVHTYGNEELEKSNYNKYLERSENAQRNFTRSMGVGIGFIFMLIFFFYGYSLYIGAWLVVDQWEDGGVGYSGGRIIGIMSCIIIGSFQLGGVAQNSKVMGEAKVAARMAYDVIDKTPTVNPDAQGASVKRSDIKGKIEFIDVNFQYPTRTDLQVLKSFSCVMEPGKTTALVGPSGSGKSTVIQLIERFYNPTSGTILIDGKDIKSLNLREFRRIVGYVGQEPVLFNTSIRDNMKFSKPDATDEEIISALKEANCWDFIGSKDKLDMNVGPGGNQLSGGQKQRVAIARAFLKKPRILLLDEATSALDSVKERKVQQAIDNYRSQVEDVTIVVIAHRLSTIRDADNIIVVKDGILVEQGNHEELLRH